jgi:hypothetical protein
MNSGIIRRVVIAAIIVELCLLHASHEGWSDEKIACPLPSLNTTDTANVQAVSGGATSIYIDGSASMAGYLGSAGAAGGRAFHDILSTLPDIVPENAQFARFGSWIEPLPNAKAARQATTAGFYQNKALNQNSSIDLAFNKASDAGAGDLTIIVTDLFLSRKDVNLESSPLRKPLTKALAAGKSVAVVGVVGEYRGRIDGNDLPSGKPFPAFVGFRPFYLVLVGPESRIIGLLERRDWKRLLADIPSDRQAVILYSHDMVGPVMMGPQPVISEKIEGVREREVLRDQRKLPQLIIDRGDFKDLKKDEAVLKVALVLEKAKTPPRPGYALGDTLHVSETLYEFIGGDDPCGRGRVADGNSADTGGGAKDTKQYWRPRSTDAIAQLQDADGQTARVAVLAGPLKRLPRDRVFLLDVQVVATRVRQEGGALAWMQKWSFEAKNEADIRRTVGTAAPGKGFLPTLNLWPLNESLIEIVNENYSGEPVARARLAFRIE